MCTKTCRTCNETKDLSDFPYQQKHGFRGQSGGYRADCKVCTAQKAREYRKTYVKSRTLRKDVDKLHYAACSMRMHDAKARAAKTGLAFDLDADFLYDMLHTQEFRCALTSTRLSFEKGSPQVLSLDKNVPALGYTRGNVRWVSWAANRAKGDLTMEEFITMCRSVVRCNDYPEMEYTQAGGSAFPSDEG